MPIILSSLLLAFCGLTYELVLAQTMSVLMGNSYLQYGLTIGLFMAGLGAGALTAENVRSPGPSLLRLQSILCLIAPAGYLALWFSALYFSPLVMWPLACALIFTIGFLTGKELPLLMELAGTTNGMIVLAADYIGMLAASIFFPYVLLPRLGMLGTICAAALLNALSIQLLLAFDPLNKRLRFSVLPVLLAVLLFFEEPIWQWFSQQYISGRV